MVWGVIVATVRQRSVQLGSLLGGLFAHAWAIATPFWIAVAVMTAIAAAWRPLRNTA